MQIDIAPHIVICVGALMNEHSLGIEYKALLLHVQEYHSVYLFFCCYDKRMNSTS